MKRYAMDILREKGGDRYHAYDCVSGCEVKAVAWIDEEAGTFGQYVLADNGQKQIDPYDRSKLWIVERVGRLRLEPMADC